MVAVIAVVVLFVLLAIGEIGGYLPSMGHWLYVALASAIPLLLGVIGFFLSMHVATISRHVLSGWLARHAVWLGRLHLAIGGVVALRFGYAIAPVDIIVAYWIRDAANDAILASLIAVAVWTFFIMVQFVRALGAWSGGLQD